MSLEAKVIEKLKEYCQVRGGPIQVKFTQRTFFDSLNVPVNVRDRLIVKLRKLRYQTMLEMARTPKNSESGLSLCHTRQTENEEFNDWLNSHIKKNRLTNLTDEQWYEVYNTVFRDYSKHYVSPLGYGYGATIQFVHGMTEGPSTKSIRDMFKF